jgi:hypothetical protein
LPSKLLSDAQGSLRPLADGNTTDGNFCEYMGRLLATKKPVSSLETGFLWQL